MQLTYARPLDVMRENKGETAVVSFRGDVGLDRLQSLESALNQISAIRPKVVEFDFGQATSIASLAIGLLIRCGNAVRRHGGTVKIVRPNEVIHDVLVRCRLNEVFEIALPVGTR